MESKMPPYAWKFTEEDNGIVYAIQFNEVPWKLKKVLNEAMKDWSTSAVGWHRDSGNQLFLFKKVFKSQAEWEAWADRFPMQIQEKRYWGDKEKVVIHGKKKK